MWRDNGHKHPKFVEININIQEGQEIPSTINTKCPTWTNSWKKKETVHYIQKLFLKSETMEGRGQ